MPWLLKMCSTMSKCDAKCIKNCVHLMLVWKVQIFFVRFGWQESYFACMKTMSHFGVMLKIYTSFTGHGCFRGWHKYDNKPKSDWTHLPWSKWPPSRRQHIHQHLWNYIYQHRPITAFWLVFSTILYKKFCFNIGYSVTNISKSWCAGVV